MKTNSILAKDLVEIEEALNFIEYEHIPTGGLAAKFNENIYRGIFRRRSLFYNLASLMNYIFIGLFQKKMSLSTSKSASNLMFSKLADKAQCNKLIDPLTRHYKDSISWKFYEKGDVNNYKGIISLKLLELPFLFHRTYQLSKEAKQHYVNFPEIKLLDIFLVYLFGIIQLQNWIHFFRNSEINLLVVDYDRDNRSSAMVLAAKSQGIKTITLVHGAMNPPYGFYPIIADRIFVWGNFQSEYLNSKGVAPEKVLIVGNSIVDKIERRVNPPVKDHRIPVGIALNPMGDGYNKQFLKHIIDYSINNNEVKFIVKLHASMTISDWMIEVQNENLFFYSFHDLTTPNFFSQIDTLIVGNSAIGYESVLNDIPVGVICIGENDQGNDFVMISNGGFLDITEKNAFNQFLTDIKNKETLDMLLEKEKVFVLEKYYYATGNVAVNNVITLLDETIAL